MAAALPVLMLLVLAGLYAVQLANAQARCVDAAREAARAAARDDPRAAELGRLAAGRGAQISIDRGTDTVTVVVTVRIRPAGIDLPGVTLTERAVAATENSERARAPDGAP